jgi:hypothetical protein
MQLETNYSEDLSLPGMLLGSDDCTNNVLTDLFGDNFQPGNILITNLLLHMLTDYFRNGKYGTRFTEQKNSDSTS